MPYTKADKKKFLNLFYEYYPDEYKAVFKRSIITEKMYTIIMDTYPVLFAEIMSEYDKLYID